MATLPKIGFVVPEVARDHFSGGIYCIFEYAQRLTHLGHQVQVISVRPSPYPRWFGRLDFGFVSPLNDTDDPAALAGPTDVTVATTCDTAALVAQRVRGAKLYFMQHFAPLFGECRTAQVYSSSLKLVANSTWLGQQVRALTARTDVDVCPNGLDRTVFRRPVAEDIHFGRPDDRIVVISYGGREAPWKGFREMAEAVAIVRRTLPIRTLEWRVFGGALLPARNNVACYTDLGRLGRRQLAAAYRDADLLLSASWYESFPLYPLEAMACGVATITSRIGTEDYAHHGLTAHIIEARRPENIAAGLQRVIENVEYRNRLALAGVAEARKFTWERATACMSALMRSTA